MGPDLAFLRMPKFAMDEIEKLASVLDGERQRDVLLDKFQPWLAPQMCQIFRPSGKKIVEGYNSVAFRQ